MALFRLNRYTAVLGIALLSYGFAPAWSTAAQDAGRKPFVTLGTGFATTQDTLFEERGPWPDVGFLPSRSTQWLAQHLSIHRVIAAVIRILNTVGPHLAFSCGPMRAYIR